MHTMTASLQMLGGRVWSSRDLSRAGVTDIDHQPVWVACDSNDVDTPVYIFAEWKLSSLSMRDDFRVILDDATDSSQFFAPHIYGDARGIEAEAIEALARYAVGSGCYAVPRNLVAIARGQAERIRWRTVKSCRVSHAPLVRAMWIASLKVCVWTILAVVFGAAALSCWD